MIAQFFDRKSLPFWLGAVFYVAVLAIASSTIYNHPETGTAAVASVALLAIGAMIALYQVRIFPFLLLLGIVSGQLIRLRLAGDSSASLLLIDGIMVIYTVFGGLYALATRKRIDMPASAIWLIGFAGWMILSLLWGSRILLPKEALAALFYALRFLFMTGTIFVTIHLLDREKPYRALMASLLATGVLTTLLGYLQLFIFPNFAFMTKYGWDPHVGRLLSTFFDPNFFGMFLVIIFSLLFAYALFAKRPTHHLLLWGTMAIILGALVLTFSRSAYLAFLVSVFVIMLLRAWKQVLILLVILGVVATAVPRVKTRIIGALNVDATAQDRIQSWKETLTIVRDHPIVGVGYNAFGPAQIRYGFKTNLLGHSTRGSDSSLLLILATTGLIGLILYLMFFAWLIYEAVLVYRFHASPFIQSTALALLGIIPAYFVHSQFVNSLFYPLIFVPFGLIVATVLFGLRALPEQRR